MIRKMRDGVSGKIESGGSFPHSEFFVHMLSLCVNGVSLFVHANIYRGGGIKTLSYSVLGNEVSICAFLMHQASLYLGAM